MKQKKNNNKRFTLLAYLVISSFEESMDLEQRFPSASETEASF
jgi:hypothetical protein